MNNRYSQIMDQVQLSDESRQRILCRIGQSKHALSLSYHWISIAAAACVVLIAGVCFLPHLTQKAEPERPNRIVASTGVEQAADREELSKMVGFPVMDLAEIETKADKVEYLSFHKNLAQITCTRGTETIVFRQARGSEDCSADYTSYTEIQEIEQNGLAVTLKGESPQSYVLAIWVDDSYTYAIKCTQACSVEEWESLLENMI